MSKCIVCNAPNDSTARQCWQCFNTIFKAGDRVRVLALDIASHPIAHKNGLDVGEIRTLRLSTTKNDGRLVIPYLDRADSLGMVLVAKGLVIELIKEQAQQKTIAIKQEEEQEDEGKRMLRFFKSSSHDPNARW